MPDRSLTGKSRWFTPVAIAILVVIFAVCMVLGAKHASGDGESFAGSDDAAEKAAQEAGAEPWFEPIFEPKSGEVESGLFAIQAALGSGILCFALGRMSGKRVANGRTDAASATEPTLPVA